MLNALQTYDFETSPVRVVMRDGEPWFVANDVCAILALKNPRDAVGRLDEDEKGVANADPLYSTNTPAPGGAQEMTIISESGVYSLIFRSRTAAARRFRKWVTSEVLPAIRRTGRYQAPAVAELRLTNPSGLIREAHRLYGPEGAHNVWRALGLPDSRMPPLLNPLPAARPLASLEDDPLLDPLKAWLDRRISVSIAEAIDELWVQIVDARALKHGDSALRRRLGALMRHLGWKQRTARQGDKVIRVFVSPEREG